MVLLTLAFVISAYSLISFFSQTEVAQSELSEVYAIDPKPTDMKMRINLYFPFENKLRIEERLVTVSQERLEVAIAEELRKGPKNLAFTHLFKGDVQILDVKISNNICYVNLSESFLDQNYITGEKSELYVWSIVNTFSEIDNVYRVQILIEGRRRDVNIGETNLYQILTRNSDFIYTDRRYPSDSVIEFIDAVIDQRYDKAYAYLSKESQTKYPYEGFKRAIEKHFDALQGYRRAIYFTQGFSQSWIVYVKYISADRIDPDTTTSLFDLWEVIEEGEDWKIIFDK
jgi:hypothetical protein